MRDARAQVSILCQGVSAAEARGRTRGVPRDKGQPGQ